MYNTVLHVQGAPCARINAHEFFMLLGNLPQNAHRHAGLSVRGELSSAGGGAVLVVSDDGPAFRFPGIALS